MTTLQCRIPLAIAFSCLLTFSSVTAQIAPQVQQIFPRTTVVHGNIPYADDTLKGHLLDVYLPANLNADNPLLVWIHGGAWNHNDKYSDMGYMATTIRRFLEKGYALASIDYRYSTDAPFPAQVQDCNKALEYLSQHAGEFGFDKNKIVLIGFSAGGHLASLVGLASNNPIGEFYADNKSPSFRIRGVIDFYGPSDFLAMIGNNDAAQEESDPVSQLLGASPLSRPDLAKRASPVTYIDKNDPPFLIIHGEHDESVPPAQSKLLSSWLKIHDIPHELIIVPNAPHFGVMFDAPEIQEKVFAFLESVSGL